MTKLSIIIPCYNEAEGLPKLVAEINTSMSRGDVEVVLVNNGSSDNSAAILAELTATSPFMRVVSVTKNEGYGGGILQGLAVGRGTYLGWMHGDLQTPFKDVLRALKKIEALGEPEDIYVKGLRKGRSLFDHFFTLGMSIFETALLQKKLFDINAQPNIFHRNFFHTWNNPPHDFSLDLYVLFMARVRGLNIIRIPVDFPPRTYGHSHWNTGLLARFKFIKRTIKFSVELSQKIGHETGSFQPVLFAKYLIAGGIAGAVHLGLLYALTEFFHIHYLVSTTMALFVVFWISFYLQKRWTFENTSHGKTRIQMFHYFLMHSISFIMNAALMYAFVSLLGVWYMFSQVIVSLGLAVVTFVINKKYIFKHV